MTHHGLSQMLHFSEMVFLVVFGDKKVSRIPESYVGICGSWLVRASKSHVTTRVFSVTEYKKCTQTSKIIPYLKGAPMQSWQISRCIENILFACILASVFVSVQKWSFRPLLSLQYLNLSGMNLNWVRMNLREKEKQLSSQYVNIP